MWKDKMLVFKLLINHKNQQVNSVNAWLQEYIPENPPAAQQDTRQGVPVNLSFYLQFNFV